MRTCVLCYVYTCNIHDVWHAFWCVTPCGCGNSNNTQVQSYPAIVLQCCLSLLVFWIPHQSKYPNACSGCNEWFYQSWCLLWTYASAASATASSLAPPASSSAWSSPHLCQPSAQSEFLGSRCHSLKKQVFRVVRPLPLVGAPATSNLYIQLCVIYHIPLVTVD